MVVRLRLSRFGCRNKPFYRIMAADSRSPRDGKHLEVLGYYNPLPGQDDGKRMGLNFDRMKYLKDVWMESEEDPVKRERVVEARARNISHNVRCTECGSQSIEDSQADIAILLRKLIRDEIRDGKSDKEIYKKLGEEYGETVLYEPKFDLQTAGLWLSPLLVAGVAGGMWAYKKHRQKTNVHIMALNLVRGVPLTPREKETMLEVLTPPPPEGASYWWRRWLR